MPQIEITQPPGRCASMAFPTLIDRPGALPRPLAASVSSSSAAPRLRDIDLRCWNPAEPGSPFCRLAGHRRRRIGSMMSRHDRQE